MGSDTGWKVGGKQGKIQHPYHKILKKALFLQKVGVMPCSWVVWPCNWVVWGQTESKKLICLPKSADNVRKRNKLKDLPLKKNSRMAKICAIW